MAHPDLDMLADRAMARLHAAAPDLAWSDADVARCRQVALASDFAIATWCREPAALARLLADADAAPQSPPALDPGQRHAWEGLLRRYRSAESARLVWRDVLGLDDVDATLAGSTRLAETCLALALAGLEEEFSRRHGVVRAGPDAVRLVVFGLGKLGGGELNFSSDVDLVLGYAADGDSDGARPLAAEDYFARLGQQLSRMLDEVTADGFCHRVDLRLRPFGTAGRVALSFAALEQYFQREGRDWERYAWQKARPVAGDLAQGEAFLDTLRPFVYRRYLDYGALDGLRGMKAAIAAEVARKDMADDIKRGPGGIREVEFLAQALQLIRGGREPALRERRLVPALEALRDAGHLPGGTVATLVGAYRFLRRLENRLQMRHDAQVHALPADPLERERIAVALGYGDWPALGAELEAHRAAVATEFAALLAPRRGSATPTELSAYWRALPDAGDIAALDDAGFDDAVGADAALRDFARSPGVRDLSDIARARLDRVLPVLLATSAGSPQPLLVLRRLLALLQNILRRASYLALLDEQPAALTRLVDVVIRSALLAERLARHPLLLDELLDARAAGALPTSAEAVAACAQALQHDDLEASLLALNETRQALSFRVALLTLDQRQPAQDSALQLTALADAVIGVVVLLARREMAAAHGVVPGSRFAVLGYGSLGGRELGFGSDLDLVFLYDAPPDAASDGPRPLDAPRWFARMAQKVVSLLGTPSAAGRLYEADVRLRPDGAKGLLVSTLSSFDDYQRARAWTWEHQALVRARCVDGDAGLCEAFEAVRAQTLARVRDPAVLRQDIVAMRARMRAELDRSDAARFDLKQGEGGLVDLEFLLQHAVLAGAARDPRLLRPRDTPALLVAAADAGLVDGAAVAGLQAAHATLLAAGLACTLDRRQRLVPLADPIEAARQAVREASAAAGLRASDSDTS